ncbi:MAG TPA: DUF222 domain-containing protein, partial [Acidimicrobiales bacterium]|nr:DUF222 domain-containing protein [Acidimicrobiales bacterium]
MLTLREIEREMAEVSASFDAALLDLHGARLAVEKATRIEKIAASLRTRAAARLAALGSYRERGEKSPAHELAKLSGVPVVQAAAELSAADQLVGLPEVADAAARGELSSQQTTLIAGALSANPRADAGALLDKAKRLSHSELRSECDRLKAEADRGAEERRKRIHDERFLRRSSHADGSSSITLRDNPERIAAVMAAIQPKRQELFDAARRDGRRERSEALDADALVATVTEKGTGGKRGGGSQAKILVRIDLDALLRGYPIEGEVTEIAGYGPVPVSVINEMLATGNAFLAAIVTDGKKVVGVAHLGRAPNAWQQSALEWKDPVCTTEGCPQVGRLERDHRIDWAQSKITLIDWLDRVCDHCHD